MLRRGELQKAMGGAPLVYQSRTERLAQAKGRTYYYWVAPVVSLALPGGGHPGRMDGHSVPVISGTVPDGRSPVSNGTDRLIVPAAEEHL